jgi:serine phosphatase RsbU (regulator of sigma subunit)
VLLSHLNRLLCASTAAASTATAVVARYEPATRRLVWAQAGHPPLLHVRAGATTELPRPRGPLLGAALTARYETAETTLERADLLLLYTDGLVEHRDQSLREGLAPVVATLNRISAARQPQPLATLLAELRRANPDDDTCVVAARPLDPPEASP